MDIYVVEQFNLTPATVISDMRQLIQDGIHRTVFHLRDDQWPSDEQAKARMMADIATKEESYVSLRDRDFNFMACFWLSDFSGSVASCNYAIAKAHWDKTRQLSEFVVKFLQEHTGLTGLVGMTPAVNRRGIAFAKRSGFKELATIPDGSSVPGGSCDMVVTYLNLRGEDA